MSLESSSFEFNLDSSTSLPKQLVTLHKQTHNGLYRR